MRGLNMAQEVLFIECSEMAQKIVTYCEITVNEENCRKNNGIKLEINMDF